MREARQERSAEFLELLADNLAAAGAGRGAHHPNPTRPVPDTVWWFQQHVLPADKQGR